MTTSQAAKNIQYPAQQGFLQHIKSSALNSATKSPFYDWTLSSKHIPHSLAVKLIDPWPGDMEAARSLCKPFGKQEFSFEGSIFPIKYSLWDEYSTHPSLKRAIHSFAFLRDLKSLGGDVARKTARDLTEEWLSNFDKYHPDYWDPKYISMRLYYWITAYDFFGASAGNEFQQQYFDSVIRQARHLSRSIQKNIHGIDLLRAGRGLAYAGLSFKGREQWVIQGFEILLNEIPKQILSDGGHISRSPQTTAEAFQILLDLRCALIRAELPVPELIQNAIDRSGQAIKFFKLNDKKLPLFHGGQEGAQYWLDALSQHIASSNKILKALPETGYERVSVGRTVVMVDTGGFIPAPHDKTAHSSPLSFEVSYGRERVFTNCGSHPVNGEWQHILRHTAAHNNLTLNGGSAHDILPQGGFVRRLDPIKIKRQDFKDSCLLDMTHNAWQSSHNIEHRRRLYIAEGGLDIRGEDTLSSDLDPEDALDIAIRFHLHPRVLVSLVQDGQEALLRLHSGLGFRFFSVGGTLSLENSIYCGTGLKPQKTKQLVVTKRMIDKQQQIKWALQRE
jgi:uncharacterized heparinase superfamily protein